MRVEKELFISKESLEDIKRLNEIRYRHTWYYDIFSAGIRPEKETDIKIAISWDEPEKKIEISESEFEAILKKLHIADNELYERAIGRALRYELFHGGEK